MSHLLEMCGWIVGSIGIALLFDWAFFERSTHFVDGWVDKLTYKETVGPRFIVTVAGACCVAVGFVEDIAVLRGLGAVLVILSTGYALFLVWKGRPQ